jgi:hypothetical protein
MVRRTLGCCVLVGFISCVSAFGQRTPQRRTPQQTSPPVNPPARATAPQARPKAGDADAKEAATLRPPGSKPVSVQTAQKETARLKESIAKLEERLAAAQDKKEGGKDVAEAKAAEGAVAAADAEGPAEKVAAKAKPAGEAPAPFRKATLPAVERENRTLRRQLDALLIKVAKAEGVYPAQPPGMPPYDPHIMDRPNNNEFCPGKTLDQLEYSMLFSGRPIAEIGDDEVVYEWVFHTTNKTRSKHATHKVWAQIKDGTAAQVMEGAPGVVTEGPPPKTTL